MLPGAVTIVEVAKIFSDRGGQQRDLALHQPRRADAGVGIVQGIGEIVKHVQAFYPLVHGSQRQLNLKNDAVGAVGMMQQQRFGCRDGQYARDRFDGHHFDAEHIAGRRQRPIVDGADAAEPAAVKAAQARQAVGRRHTAQLPARRAGGGFDVRQANAGLGPHRAVAEGDDLVEPGHIHQHPSFERDQLSIVAGGAAAQGQRQLMLRAGSDQLAQLLFIARANHRVRLFSRQLLGEYRTEPVKIAGKPFEFRRLQGPLQRRECLLDRRDRLLTLFISHHSFSCSSAKH